jgi:beta-mannosidase
MDLGGQWAAAEADDDLRRQFPRPDFDDGGWQPVMVPGHWRGEAAFAASDGPLLFRRPFSSDGPAPGQRVWLVMDGVFYQSDVWLDGSYLGDTEGYFFPHAFDVTAAMQARPEHLLAVDVVCDRPARRAGKRALLGVWGDEGCIDPAYNPGGIWAPVNLVSTGPVRISSLRLSCSEAGPRRAVLDISAILDSAERLTVTLRTEARLAAGAKLAADVANQQPLAVGTNRVRWRLEVPAPELWWPVGLGRQPLYEVAVAVDLPTGRSDERCLRTGLREVRMHNFRWVVNGEELFLRGANLAPTRRDLAGAAPAQVAADVDLACQAGLNLLRARAHVGRPELYQAADTQGVLIWQDMPVHGRFRGTRRQAVRQAGKAVDVLGHHPSIVLWCGHNEPFPVGPAGPGWRPGRALWRVAAQALPDPSRSVLDRSIRRSLERADPSRPVIANSGVLPSVAREASSHLYFGWYHGRFRDLPRAARLWPAAARFVAEIGAQSVPCPAPFMAPERWPDLDWAQLAEHYCLQKGVFDRRVPPRRYSSFESWSAATQAYQANVVRSQVEALRRLRDHPTGGFAVHCLNDAQPAVSCSLVDFERRPKAAFAALVAACGPVLVMADWPEPSYMAGGPASFDVHVVNDGRLPLAEAMLEARLTWPGGGRVWRFAGDVPVLSCTFVGRLSATLPGVAVLPAPATAETEAGAEAAAWPLSLDLRLSWGSPPQSVANHYQSLFTAVGPVARGSPG